MGGAAPPLPLRLPRSLAPYTPPPLDNQARALAAGYLAATVLLVRQTSSWLAVAPDGAAELGETARLLGIVPVPPPPPPSSPPYLTTPLSARFE